VSQGRELESGYTSEVDTLDEETWDQILQEFDDASLYQTWAYASVMARTGNTSHVVLRRHGEIVAMGIARIAMLPLVKLGIAYIGNGPLWRRRASAADTLLFRQMLRALRNEFVCRRRLVLRISPALFTTESRLFCEILAEEGFLPQRKQLASRTILLDLTPELSQLRAGLGRNWKRNLKHAEDESLEIVEGTDETLFEAVIKIYREMSARKKFVEPNDIEQFKRLQARLPEKLRMKIMLCKTKGDACAALVWTALGNTGIELFAATSEQGTQIRGASHLLRWNLVKKLRSSGFLIYDLNGINPDINPGTYRFKSELAGKHGRDVYYLGRFDSRPGVLTYSVIQFGDAFRAAHRTLKQFTTTRLPATFGRG
jgi:lipid II:glycine glycyltransferase (peptidoglycan interpeptide bridge formation enzyme)